MLNFLIKNRERTLYIYAHIPKTAGSTFRNQVETSFNPDEYLSASLAREIPLEENLTRDGKVNLFKSKTSLLNHISQLTIRQKRGIKMIFGHDAFFGIDKLFNKQAKYILFLREPISRTMSIYNYERMTLEILSSKQGNQNKLERYMQRRIQERFLINGDIPSFESWLDNKYDKREKFYFSMTHFLQEINYIADEINEKTIKEGLALFYFIGFTDNYREDASFLYNEIGVKYFIKDKNISKKYISLKDLSQETIQKIIDKNKYDFLLYGLAKKINNEFKRQNNEFYRKVNRMKIINTFFFIPRLLEDRIYPLSARLKRRSKMYTNILVFIKKLFPKNKRRLSY